MIFSRISLRPDVSFRDLVYEDPDAKRTAGHAEHRLLWRLFGDHPDRRRDFLFRREDRGHRAAFLAVSERPPEDPGGAWLIESKEYAPQLATGQRLAFALRANPVVSRRDDDKKQSRHDVVMDAKTELKRQGVPRNEWPPLLEICQQAGAAWLAGRAPNHGFDAVPAEIVCDGYRQLQFGKSNGHQVRFSTLDLTGLLTVTEPEALVQALFQGVGPAKAYGCGLLLVRPA